MNFSQYGSGTAVQDFVFLPLLTPVRNGSIPSFITSTMSAVLLYDCYVNKDHTETVDIEPLLSPNQRGHIAYTTDCSMFVCARARYHDRISDTETLLD